MGLTKWHYFMLAITIITPNQGIGFQDIPQAPKVANSINPKVVMAVPNNRKEKDIIQQLSNSFSSLLGHPGELTKTSSPDLINPLTRPMQASQPIQKPGTANVGGIVSDVVALFSGITAGFIGLLGINKPEDPIRIPLLQYIITASPSNYNLEDAEAENEISSSASKQQNKDPVKQILDGIFVQAAGCNEIRRVLGQC